MTNVKSISIQMGFLLPEMIETGISDVLLYHKISS